LDGEDSNERQLRQNPIERVRVSEKWWTRRGWRGRMVGRREEEAD
jgi:hypothetical protein